MCDSCFAWLMGAGWAEDEAAESGASSTALAVHPFKRKKHEGDSKVICNFTSLLFSRIYNDQFSHLHTHAYMHIHTPPQPTLNLHNI